MSVEYRASTGTNMTSDKRSNAYKQMPGDTNRLRLSVHALRNNPSKVAALLLGLLSVILLVVHKQNQYDSLVQHRNQRDADYGSVSQECDNLEKKFNNVSRVREQLQLLYNDLVKNMENLQVSHNLSASELDQLAKSHRNLTEQQAALEATCTVIRKVEEELRVSYGALVTEKNELEVNLKNATVEHDRLRERNDYLTAQRDQLEDALDNRNLTVKVAAKRCSSGWTKFGGKCYYRSAGKKNWHSARSFCLRERADLAVINSTEEMVFLNGLYSRGKELWIGLTDQDSEGNFVWVDGSPLTLTFWGANQPNSHNEEQQQDCVEIWHQITGIGEWNDESCNLKRGWLCEM